MGQSFEIGIQASKNVVKALDDFLNSSEAKENLRHYDKSPLFDGSAMYRMYMRDHPSWFPIGRSLIATLKSFDTSCDPDDAYKCVMAGDEGGHDSYSNEIGAEMFTDLYQENGINYPESFDSAKEEERIEKIRQTRLACDATMASNKLFELLNDKDVSFYEAFEDMSYRYINENADFRNGMDVALSILTKCNMSELSDIIAKEAV